MKYTVINNVAYYTFLLISFKFVTNYIQLLLQISITQYLPTTRHVCVSNDSIDLKKKAGVCYCIK